MCGETGRGRREAIMPASKFDIDQPPSLATRLPQTGSRFLSKLHLPRNAQRAHKAKPRMRGCDAAANAAERPTAP
jgi:hypothetical protein